MGFGGRMNLQQYAFDQTLHLDHLDPLSAPRTRFDE
jgi:hypothetical protein